MEVVELVFHSHVNLRRTSTFKTNYCSLLSLEMLREAHTFCFGDIFETRSDSNKVTKRGD